MTTELESTNLQSTNVQSNVAEQPQYEAIIIGAGVCGIYQLYRMVELGVSATVLEAGADLGGTWFWNRYPGARFDSESITYGYSFSKELLQEWNWKERFSGQPENLRYLNYVADKFDLRPYMQFNCTVESAHFDDVASLWRLHLADGRDL
ncbi:MAG: NAD(P)/FAD-dependent oxidoreductase, partial [Ilumatobacteraceae bacterium]